MSTPQSPALAAGSAATVVSVGLPTGYVQLDDKSVLERMLSNIADNAALLAAVKAHHTLDADGSLLMAFTRLAGMEEAEAIEVRMIRNWLGAR